MLLETFGKIDIYLMIELIIMNYKKIEENVKLLLKYLLMKLLDASFQLNIY